MCAITFEDFFRSITRVLMEQSGFTQELECVDAGDDMVALVDLMLPDDNNVLFVCHDNDKNSLRDAYLNYFEVEYPGEVPF